MSLSFSYFDEDGNIRGPYTCDKMQLWFDAGYLSDNNTYFAHIEKEMAIATTLESLIRINGAERPFSGWRNKEVNGQAQSANFCDNSLPGCSKDASPSPLTPGSFDEDDCAIIDSDSETEENVVSVDFPSSSKENGNFQENGNGSDSDDNLLFRKRPKSPVEERSQQWETSTSTSADQKDHGRSDYNVEDSYENQHEDYCAGIYDEEQCSSDRVCSQEPEAVESTSNGNGQDETDSVVPADVLAKYREHFGCQPRMPFTARILFGANKKGSDILKVISKYGPLVRIGQPNHPQFERLTNEFAEELSAGCRICKCSFETSIEYSKHVVSVVHLNNIKPLLFHEIEVEVFRYMFEQINKDQGYQVAQKVNSTPKEPPSKHEGSPAFMPPPASSAPLFIPPPPVPVPNFSLLRMPPGMASMPPPMVAGPLPGRFPYAAAGPFHHPPGMPILAPFPSLGPMPIPAPIPLHRSIPVHPTLSMPNPMQRQSPMPITSSPRPSAAQVNSHMRAPAAVVNALSPAGASSIITGFISNRPVAESQNSIEPSAEERSEADAQNIKKSVLPMYISIVGCNRMPFTASATLTDKMTMSGSSACQAIAELADLLLPNHPVHPRFAALTNVLSQELASGCLICGELKFETCEEYYRHVTSHDHLEQMPSLHFFTPEVRLFNQLFGQVKLDHKDIVVNMHLPLTQGLPQEDAEMNSEDYVTVDELITIAMTLTTKIYTIYCVTNKSYADSLKGLLRYSGCQVCERDTKFATFRAYALHVFGDRHLKKAYNAGLAFLKSDLQEFQGQLIAITMGRVSVELPSRSAPPSTATEAEPNTSAENDSEKPTPTVSPDNKALQNSIEEDISRPDSNLEDAEEEDSSDIVVGTVEQEDHFEVGETSTLTENESCHQSSEDVESITTSICTLVVDEEAAPPVVVIIEQEQPTVSSSTKPSYDDVVCPLTDAYPLLSVKVESEYPTSTTPTIAVVQPRPREVEPLIASPTNSSTHCDDDFTVADDEISAIRTPSTFNATLSKFTHPSKTKQLIAVLVFLLFLAAMGCVLYFLS